jgi:hypothetical protein
VDWSGHFFVKIPLDRFSDYKEHRNAAGPSRLEEIDEPKERILGVRGFTLVQYNASNMKQVIC